MTVTVTNGADVERLAGIATTLREQGCRLETLTRQGGTMVDLLSGSWSGADLDGFSERWGTGEQELRRAAVALDECSRELQRQAGQQETTSAGGSFSPSGGSDARPPSAAAAPSVVAALPGGLGVDPKAAGTCPTNNMSPCDELTPEDLERIEREKQIDTDSPVVVETKDGKINAAEAAVFGWWLMKDGPDKVDSMMDIKREADGAGRAEYGNQPLDQQEDAFRHAYWNARMTQEHGEGDARMLSNAHEMHEDPTPLDDKREAMDLHNNEVGRRIAQEHPDASPEELKTRLREAVECGEMVCIDTDGNLRPSNYNLQ